MLMKLNCIWAKLVEQKCEIMICYRDSSNPKVDNRVPSVELIAEADILHPNESSKVVKIEKSTKDAIDVPQETDVCDINKPGTICIDFGFFAL